MTKKCNNLVVLAAGISSRMKQEDPTVKLNSSAMQQANTLSKSLITIGKKGEVILDFLLNNAQKAGFKNVYLITGNNNAFFKAHFKNKDLQFKLHFAVQTIPSNRVKPLGTADAVYQLLVQYPKLKEDYFVVCNSDNLYSVKAFSALRNCDKNQALISYNREALKFSAERISKFAIIDIKNNYVETIEEKPDTNNLNSYADAEGNIYVSMNLFKLSGKLIYHFVKNCPLHPIRQEKELPVAINNYLKDNPLNFKAIPLSEHVPDLTSKKDILILREEFN